MIAAFLEKLIPWFISYKYALVFPVAVLEGPIVTILTGFLVSLGYMNFFIAYLVVVTGDIIGDVLYYGIGHYGREKFIAKHGHYIGITLERLQKMENYFNRHGRKTLFIAKFAQGFGTVTWIAAGVAKVPMDVFLSVVIPSTAIKSFIFMLIGYFFGKTYLSLSTSIGYASLIVLGALIALYVFVAKSKLLTRLWEKFNNQ